jgi:7-keto-8-aminopelargonate synthetase-like enzyme
LLPYLEIHANNVEYPLAPLGGAVVRFSLTPQHTHAQIDRLVTAFDFSLKKAKTVRGQQKSTPAAKL